MLEAFLIKFIISIIVVSCKGYIDTILSTLFVSSSVVLQSKGYIKFTFIISSYSIVPEQGLHRYYLHHSCCHRLFSRAGVISRLLSSLVILSIVLRSKGYIGCVLTSLYLALQSLPAISGPPGSAPPLTSVLASSFFSSMVTSFSFASAIASPA